MRGNTINSPEILSDAELSKKFTRKMTLKA